MTHEELLAKINDIRTNYLPETTSELAWKKLADTTRALRAVAELHKPDLIWKNEDTHIVYCSCGNEYPCSTIQVIKKELQ